MTSSAFHFVCVLCLLHFAQSQDQARLTFDKERIYDKDHFTLTCHFPHYYALTSVVLDAFNNTNIKGSMYCNIATNTQWQTGVFNGSTFDGCPIYPGATGYVRVFMQASPALELDYNCTFRLNDGSRFFPMVTNSTRMELSVMPQPVYLNHRELNFNESDNVTLACHSGYGKPPAVVKMTVTQQDGSLSQDIGSVPAVVLPKPLRSWNNAKVTCTVENYSFSENLTYRGVLNISYLYRPGPTYVNVDTTGRSANLNCSAFGNPPPIYSWKMPQGTNAWPHNESIVVQAYTSGEFICTVINPVTRNQVVVTFYAKPWHSEIAGGVVASVCVIIGAVVVLILYKQGRLTNGKLSLAGGQKTPAIAGSMGDALLEPISQQL